VHDLVQRDAWVRHADVQVDRVLSPLSYRPHSLPVIGDEPDLVGAGDLPRLVRSVDHLAQLVLLDRALSLGARRGLGRHQLSLALHLRCTARDRLTLERLLRCALRLLEQALAALDPRRPSIAPSMSPERTMLLSSRCRPRPWSDGARRCRSPR
jgi:hypothetical protein